MTVRILVTGAAGFIGSAYVRHVLGEHPDDLVFGLDLLTYAGNMANLEEVRDDPRFRFVQGDIADAELIGQVATDVDAIVNFAAESHVDRSLLDPGAFARANVIGVMTLLEAARTNGLRLLQVSTDEVYGHVPAGQAATEDSPLQPRSPYSAAKAGGELMCQAYATSYGTDVVITRGANTIGPRQYPEKLVPLFVTNALQDLPLPVYGDGRQIRNWLHAEDHAAAIDLVLRRGITGRTSRSFTPSSISSANRGRSFAMSRTGRVTIDAMPSIRRASPMSWDGDLSGTGNRRCTTPSTGTWPIRAGGRRLGSATRDSRSFTTGNTVTAWLVPQLER